MSNELKFKKCVQCGETKPVTEFSTSRSSKDGLQSWCIECNNRFNHLRSIYHEGVKVCRKCRRMLPKSRFSDSENHRDGKNTTCKDCEANLTEFDITNNVKEVKENEIRMMTDDEIVLLRLTDEQIVDELKRRGYTGEIGILKVMKL